MTNLTSNIKQVKQKKNASTYRRFLADPEVYLPRERFIFVNGSFEYDVAVTLVKFTVSHLFDSIGEEIFDLPNREAGHLAGVLFKEFRIIQGRFL